MEILTSEPEVQRLITLARKVLIQATRPGVHEMTDLGSVHKLDAYLMACQAFETVELVRVLFLNTRNRLIRDEVVMRGSVDQAAVYVRDIIHRALDLGACALILIHNHPGGSSEPGRADIAVTKSLATASSSLGIRLHDHLIVAAGGVTSLRALGYM